jgi:hypothetical protein
MKKNLFIRRVDFLLVFHILIVHVYEIWLDKMGGLSCVCVGGGCYLPVFQNLNVYEIWPSRGVAFGERGLLRGGLLYTTGNCKSVIDVFLH